MKIEGVSSAHGIIESQYLLTALRIELQCCGVCVRVCVLVCAFV